MSAATRALQAVALELLDDHLSHCVAEGDAARGDEAGREIDEASAAIARLVRRDARSAVPTGSPFRSGRRCARRSSCSGRRCGPSYSGFALSGVVQAFVVRDARCSRSSATTGLPTSAGRPSTAWCLRAAPTRRRPWPSRSLAKGADFIAAMVFMFASTNLVVELGDRAPRAHGVAVRRQPSSSEASIMIVLLLATVGGLWLRGRRIVEARDRLSGADDSGEHAEHAASRPVGDAELERQPWSEALAFQGGWADSADLHHVGLTMLRRELVIGYTVAGFLAVLVPTSVWQAVFVSGHGFWTTLENVIVGPFIAIISFVCSIGNVPLAAASWSGGISFGGVISFIFADLIAFPLLMIYRRYYGTRLMLRMLAVFWALMSTAGLITEVIFREPGWCRQCGRRRSHRHTSRGTTPRTSTSSSLPYSESCIGHTGTVNASAPGPGTPRTPCAACRSKLPTPQCHCDAAGSASTSARTTAPTGSGQSPD